MGSIDPNMKPTSVVLILALVAGACADALPVDQPEGEDRSERAEAAEANGAEAPTRRAGTDPGPGAPSVGSGERAPSSVPSVGRPREPSSAPSPTSGPTATVTSPPPSNPSLPVSTPVAPSVPLSTPVPASVPLPATDTLIDIAVLTQSMAHIAMLTVSVGGRPLFKRTQEEIDAFAPQAGQLNLTSAATLKHWRDTLWAWTYRVSMTPHADASRILLALSSYFVGVSELIVGPRCGPISFGYMYGFVPAGRPGDQTPAVLDQEVARSEAAIEREIQQVATRCVAALSARGEDAAVDVYIDLPADPNLGVSDLDIWSVGAGGDRIRVGAPVPAPTPEHVSARL